jgi:hypothetical protein
VINSVLFGKYRNRTEFTDTEFPRYRVSLGTDRYQFPEEPNLHRYRRTEPNRTEVPNAQGELNVPPARKSFWTHTMELLGDVCHVESYFIPFGDNDNLDAR